MTPGERTTFLKKLEVLQDSFHECEEIGKALREFNKTIWDPFFRTPFSRYRNLLLRSIKQLLQAARNSLREKPSAELVRVEVRLESIEKCCKECVRHNWDRKVFECLIKKSGIKLATSISTINGTIYLNEDGGITKDEY